MKNNKIFLYLIFFGLGISACSPIYYIPETHNVPLISEKGEVDVAGSISFNQAQFKAAYGLTNHIAIKANGGFLFQGGFFKEKRTFGNYIELGTGFYKPFGEFWVFETYGIFGIGKIRNSFPRGDNDIFNPEPNADGDLTAKFQRLGIQSNIGLKTDFLFCSFSSRLVHLRFHDISGDLVFDNENQMAYLQANSENLLFEPAVTFLTNRTILHDAKVGVQLGLSFNLTNRDFIQRNSYIALMFNYSIKTRN